MERYSYFCIRINVLFYGFKLHLGSIFRNCFHCGTLQAAIHGRHRDIYATRQFYLRLFKDCIRNITGTNRYISSVVRRDEDRRKQWHDQCAFALAKSGILPPLSRNTEGASGYGFHLYEPVSYTHLTLPTT